MNHPFSTLTRAMSRSAVREVDQVAIERFGMSGLVLMENAGRGAAETIHALTPRGTITIICGKGNNGGDGYVIARHLELLGRKVQIVSLVELDELTGDAAANALIATKSDLPIQVAKDGSSLEEAIGQPATLVDCMLGTGAQGPPRTPYSDAIRIANRLNCTRIAIDIPSGLDCDSGLASEPTFTADHTLTFVAPKLGFESDQAKPFVGKLTVLPIGIPYRMIAELRQAPQ